MQSFRRINVKIINQYQFNITRIIIIFLKINQKEKLRNVKQ